MKKIITLTVLLGLICSPVFAKPRRSRRSTQHYTYTNTVISDKSDQERCEDEANHMAKNRISGHVWGCIGRFEGVGTGFSPNCRTCTPSNNMTLTGDASACDNNGRWYRVRSWR